MGYSNVNAQLLTVPVYLSAAVVFLITARLSERWKVRGYFVIFNLVTMMIGKLPHDLFLLGMLTYQATSSLRLLPVLALDTLLFSSLLPVGLVLSHTVHSD